MRLPDALTELLKRRYHGAANVSGVRYQLLYFVWRAFDLYADPGPDEVLGEGVEDLDLRSVTLGNEYVQVKYRGRSLSWGDFTAILGGFLPLIAADPSASLRVVTSTGLTSDMDALAKSVRGTRPLSQRSRKALADLISQEEAVVTVDNLLQRLRFEIISEDDLLSRIRAAIIGQFGVTTGNEDLYLAALFAEVSSRAGNRIAVRRSDVEGIRQRVEEQVARGGVNPAVRDGFIRPLTFTAGADADAYYQGRAARPDHIAANFDVQRTRISERIEEVLRQNQSCIVVASSGQGKSSLAYRYTFDHYLHECTFDLRVCQEESDAGQIVQFLRARLRIGLPLLVVVDNLGARTRLWHRVVAELAGQPVAFLVTAREEDWHRYAGETASFTWQTVRPTLSLAEASQIYAELKRRGRVAPNVPSAQWAYEQVRTRGLLIEFVYLITHGRLLADRLEEQVRALASFTEDPGKLEALRLVSVAQCYGARIEIITLLRAANFRGDAQQGLRSLEGEYLVIDDGRYCEGLHPVRSEHLLRLLHDPMSVEATVAKLIAYLTPDELEGFIERALSDPTVAPDVSLQAAVERCVADPSNLLDRIARACFHADEHRYFLRHRPLYDEAYATGGELRVWLLAQATLPVSRSPAFAGLAGIEAGDRMLTWLRQRTGQFAPRTSVEHLSRQFLAGVVERLDHQRLVDDPRLLGDVLNWGHATGVVSPIVDAAIEAGKWKDAIFDLPIAAAASLAFAVSRAAPQTYREWSATERDRILGLFRWRTCTFSAVEEDDAVAIQFPADATSDAPSLNDQAVQRILLLHQFLPDYREYRSVGLYLLGENLTGLDPTQKAMTQEWIWHEVDTAKNAAWVALCLDAYATDTITSWLDGVRKLRESGLALIDQIEALYRRRCRRQPYQREVEAIRNTYFDQFRSIMLAVTSPPRVFPAAERDDLRDAVREWVSVLNFFVSQITESLPADIDQQDSRRLRNNLAGAMKSLPKVEAATVFASRWLGFTPEGETLPPEQASYRRLLDLLDFWFTVSPTENMNPDRAVREWMPSRDATFVEEIREAIEPLVQGGYRFTLPTGPLDERPLVGLCVGLEIRDFSREIADVILTGTAIGAASIAYDWIYVVPMVGQARPSEQPWRMSAGNARELAIGKVPEGMWLFRVDPPADLGAILPDIPHVPLAEQTAIEQFGSITLRAARPTIVCNAARASLDIDLPFAHELFDDLTAEANNAMEHGKYALRETLGTLRSLPVSPNVQQEWHDVLTCCQSLVDQFEQAPEEVLARLGNDRLQSLLWHYFNKAYL